MSWTMLDIVNTGDQNLEESNNPELLHKGGALVILSHVEQWDLLCQLKMESVCNDLEWKEKGNWKLSQ